MCVYVCYMCEWKRAQVHVYTQCLLNFVKMYLIYISINNRKFDFFVLEMHWYDHNACNVKI